MITMDTLMHMPMRLTMDMDEIGVSSFRLVNVVKLVYVTYNLCFI